MDTANTNVTTNATPKTKGRKPDLEKVVTKFIEKHGPAGKYGTRFNTQKQLDSLNSTIAKLTVLRDSVVIPPVVVTPVVVAPVEVNSTETTPVTPAVV